MLTQDLRQVLLVRVALLPQLCCCCSLLQHLLHLSHLALQVQVLLLLLTAGKAVRRGAAGLRAALRGGVLHMHNRGGKDSVWSVY